LSVGFQDDDLERAAPSRDSNSAEHERLKSLVETRLFAQQGALEIGRYTVLRTVGKGGMGVVYEAYDPELDRRVAIKLVRSTEQGTEGRARLQREAQSMARLTHQNVVQVYDVGTHDEQVYVVMEFVGGLGLRKWLDLKPRTAEQVLDKFVQAGKGLRAAHSIGLVHRDFKPDNVLLDESGRVLVGDFGLARSVADTGDDPEPKSGSEEPIAASESTVTQAGVILGTPAYMAPEQLRAEPLDARSDQFSFCVSLYEALYGVRPFSGKGHLRLRSIELGRLRKPKRELPVPPRVHRAMLQGLAYKPEDRFSDMDALLSQLEGSSQGKRARVGIAALGIGLLGAVGWFAFGPGVNADPCSATSEPAQAVWNEERKAEIAAAFAKVGLPYAEDVWQALSATFDDRFASWTTLREDVCRATHVRHEQSERLMDVRMACLDEHLAQMAALTELFRDPDPEIVEHALAATDGLSALSACSDTRALLDRTPPTLEQRDAVDALRLELSRADALRAAGKYPAALELASELEPSVAQLGYRALEADLQRTLGGLHGYEGRFGPSADAYHRSARAAAAAGDRRREFDAWRELARAVGRTPGQEDSKSLAQRYFEHAEGILEAIGDEPSLRVALMVDRAAVAMSSGDYAEALDRAQTALEFGRRELGEEWADGEALSQRAIAYARLGRHDAATRDFEMLIGLAAARGAAQHPSTANLHLNGSIALYYSGRYQEAIRHLEQAREIYVANFGPKHHDVALVNNNMGNVYLELGNTEQAVLHLKTAVELFTAAVGAEHPETARSVSSLASVYRDTDRVAAALELHEQALAVREKSLGTEHPDVAMDLTGIGLCKLALGRPDEARGPLERSLAIYAARPEDPSEIARAEFGLARALVADGGDTERGRALAVQARDRYRDAGGDDKYVTEVVDWLAQFDGTDEPKD
jgi:tetratricopeptide (TPR) repeat protein